MRHKRHWHHPSLQTVFILPFLVEILITVGFVGYLSFKNSQKSVEKIAYQLLDETGERIQENIANFLEIPQNILRNHQDLVNHNFLDAQDLDAWVPYLWSESQYYQSKFITTIQIANFQGEYRAAGSSYDRQGFLRQGIAIATKKNDFRIDIYYDLDDFISGNTPDELRGYFAVKKRPWFKKVMDKQGKVWTDIYVRFINNQNLAISLASPIFRPGTDEIQGVSSILVDLKYINSFLQSLNIGKTGQAFIIDQSGKLVSTSLDEDLVLIQDDQPSRVKAVDSQDSVTQEIARYIASATQEFTDFHNFELSSLKINQQRFYIKNFLFFKKNGLNWQVIIAIPESDFMAEINRNTQYTIKLCILAFLGAILIGLFTARWVTKPLIQLNDYTQKVSQGDWGNSLDLNRQDEIGELAQSFNTMVKKLQDYFSEIKENEQRVQQFLESIPLGIAIHNLEGRIYYINRQGRQLLDIVSEEQTQYSFREMNQYYKIYKADTDDLYPVEELPIFKALLGEKVYRDDVVIKHFYDPLDYEVWATPIYNQEGEIMYAIAVFQDITQRKQADRILRDYNQTLETEVKQRTEQLYHAKEVAEVANKTKSLFLANMSHELRSPLNAILGFSQLMVRTENLSHEQQENIQIIYHSGEYLLNLINNILDLSKVEAGKVSLNLTAFDLYDLFKEIEQSFQTRIADKNLKFNINYTSRVAQYICTDKIKLCQILTNFLSNSFKFTKTGEISVSVDQHNSPDATVLEFTVSDTGEGISAAELPKLFQPFSQTHSGKNAQEGTGLGLSISHKFIQLMGGEIKVESEVGQGTTFDFTIQVTPVSADQMPDSKASPRVIGLQPNQLNYRILVVDDQPTNCKLLTKFLQPVGFDVKTANNGQEAIQIWQQWQPHLIWMDMRMPVMNGYEAVNIIREQEREQKMIIIALTASIMEEEKALSLSAGCDDVVSKPFQEDVIFQMMAKHLGVRYIYEQDERSPTSTPLHQLTPEDLQHLPPQWRQEIAQASLELDDQKVLSLIEQIQLTDPELTQTLIELIHDFRFDKISELVSPSSSMG
ncbi:ATP-binding protein [Roseofilum sp. Guam]|uniref:ATP-binding protein n=1 Tax=Roseofilum sp. Guam TaxID=2821502 RepID=UPI001B21D1CA|nr:ATP-binding protein [Roseofilum sp. Guam]MBP0027088.1 response regulator [Roseofilum sp. Guam]